MLRRTLASATTAFALSIVGATDAAATGQRTFVASNGNDANPCSIAQPCRGFARAITQTSVGGEVIVLDSAGYGPVTITQSVSIIAPAGVYAGISVLTGDGVTVSAGINDIVKLRGLTINGLGGVNGIVVNTVGLFEVEDVLVSGFTFRGLYFAASDTAGGPHVSGRLTVTNSAFENNGESGLHAQAASGVATVIIDRSRFDHNVTNGAVIATNVTGSISNSVASHNASVGFLIDAGGIAMVSDCKVSDTYDSVANYGIMVRGGGTQATISRCAIFGAFDGIIATNSAAAQVVDCVTQTGGTGYAAEFSAVMDIEGSVASRAQTGFASVDSARMVVSNSTATGNSFAGFFNPGSFGAVMETRVNNTARDNFNNVVGGLSPFGPI